MVGKPVAGAEGSRSPLTNSQETGGHSVQLALPSGSVKDPAQEMMSPTFRVGFPVSINHPASLPQTYPKVCLLADYRSCQVANQPQPSQLP